MKKIIALCVGLHLFMACSKEEKEIEVLQDQDLYSVKEINAFMEDQIKTFGDVDWKKAEAKMLYSAVMRGGEVLSVGYGDKGESFSNGSKTKSTLNARQNVMNIVAENEGVLKSRFEETDGVLNVIDVPISKLETVKALLSTSQIRYLDPMGYNQFAPSGQGYQQKNAGCDMVNEPINSRDVSKITPNALLPWNFAIHKIPQAWAKSTGAGVTIGVIDTGLSSSQSLLNGDINNGASRGRSVKRFGTYIESPWPWAKGVDGPEDRCGHGTQMSAVIGSPRNNKGMPVGVAYNSNLVVYRGTSDVLLDDFHERKGVSNALVALANRSDVKIISMSIGFLYTIGNIRDAVKYAYSKGKLIICAGGTSTNFTNWYGIIFPASMRETVAVTGISDNGYKRCDICHDGNMDFTIVMQRRSNPDRNVPVLGFNNGTTRYSSGSSVATAMTSGIAALIWAKNPRLNRNQVLDKLKRSGEFYPRRDKRFGYGNINALKAVQ
ncbi:S8/S53 family peptidase [Aquimarina sp. ERC-38]|uniref:S8 family peptidase n=1 Tax=Aquimarina sp. ERC-38 TaxID=2949996 RepID=UPI00224581BF|nr:S8/S53 family peptidase [Aquimarina sp. ERC-38]UZO80794.1 S8/S53 family peptidase [Aquimarina sp. ERC-38]